MKVNELVHKVAIAQDFEHVFAWEHLHAKTESNKDFYLMVLPSRKEDSPQEKYACVITREPPPENRPAGRSLVYAATEEEAYQVGLAYVEKAAAEKVKHMDLIAGRRWRQVCRCAVN